MWQKHSAEPCVCPVDKSTVLGYRQLVENAVLYCTDCNWTYKFPANKKAAVPVRRGKVKDSQCGCGCGR